MKKTVKNCLKSSLKKLMGTKPGRRALDFVAMSRRSYLNAQAKEGLKQKLFSPPVVLNGPFKGMKYPYYDLCKLLGSYEDELHEALEQICKTAYEQVVNIGSAEGYYTVGLAIRLPAARVISFEMSERMSRLCQSICAENNVQNRVVFKGRCEPGDLQALNYSKRTLIVCDCEGYELALLKPDQTPGMQRADFLIETHDCLVPGITEELKRRFESSHRITVVKERRKDATRYPQLEGLSPFEQEVCLWEDRLSGEQPHIMEWLFLEAKNPTGQS